MIAKLSTNQMQIVTRRYSRSQLLLTFSDVWGILHNNHYHKTIPIIWLEKKKKENIM